MLPAATRSATRPKLSLSAGRNTVRRATASPMPGSSRRGGSGGVPKAESSGDDPEGRLSSGAIASKPAALDPSIQANSPYLGIRARRGTTYGPEFDHCQLPPGVRVARWRTPYPAFAAWPGGASPPLPGRRRRSPADVEPGLPVKSASRRRGGAPPSRSDRLGIPGVRPEVFQHHQRLDLAQVDDFDAAAGGLVRQRRIRPRRGRRSAAGLAFPRRKVPSLPWPWVRMQP